MSPVLKDQAGEIIRKASEYITPENPTDYFIKVGLSGPGGVVPPISTTPSVLGTTDQFVSTVGTTATSLPSTGTTAITECLIRCATGNTPVTKRLLYSFDGGSTFATLSPGEFISYQPKGGLTQIKIKGNVASVSYEVFLNRLAP